MRPTDRMKVYNRQFVARTATTDRVMRTTDREYVHTTVSLNKKHNERDDEMVQLKKIILKQTARHSQEYNSDKLLGHKGLYFTDLSLVTIYSLWYKKRYKSQLSTIPVSTLWLLLLLYWNGKSNLWSQNLYSDFSKGNARNLTHL